MKIYYEKYLKDYARQLRNNSTKSEITHGLNWKESKWWATTFIAKNPIDQYIVDFFCNKLRLAIELDGLSHQYEEVQEKDLIKERRLNELGIHVLRFQDEEVMNDMGNVLREIEGYIEEFEKTHTSNPSC